MYHSNDVTPVKRGAMQIRETLRAIYHGLASMPSCVDVKGLCLLARTVTGGILSYWLTTAVGCEPGGFGLCYSRARESHFAPLRETAKGNCTGSCSPFTLRVRARSALAGALGWFQLAHRERLIFAGHADPREGVTRHYRYGYPNCGKLGYPVPLVLVNENERR